MDVTVLEALRLVAFVFDLVDESIPYASPAHLAAYDLIRHAYRLAPGLVLSPMPVHPLDLARWHDAEPDELPF
jgi:hypothetical protein